MFEALSDWLFGSSGLTPHGFCLLWEPGLIWTYALSDAGIGLAYFSIPLALGVIARWRKDLVFRPVLLLFAAFIFLCGATHWLDVVTLWLPINGVQALVKAATALVSIATAVALWKLMPAAIVLPSPLQLREANAALRATEERLHLQAVAGGLTLIERRIASGRYEGLDRLVDQMRRALNSATGLTSRLLAFSRRQALQPKRIEPDHFIAGMKEFLQRTLGPEIGLALELGDGKSDAICDPHQLEAVLLNLAINARDAMPEGGRLTILVSDRKLKAADLADQDQANPGDYVEIKVSDTGVGMTPDVLSRAFEPFFTTKPTGGGTGLGLSQVYGFVRQSGGFSRIESEPGSGTSVLIFLPSRPRVEGEASSPPRIDEGTRPRAPGATVPADSAGHRLRGSGARQRPPRGAGGARQGAFGAKARRRHGLMRRSSRHLAADRANPLGTGKRTANLAVLDARRSRNPHYLRRLRASSLRGGTADVSAESGG